MDCSLLGSSVHGIFQVRILEWVVISFSRDFPNPVIESRSPELKADSLLTEPPGKSIVVSVAYSKETWEEVVSSFGKIYLRLDKPYLAMRDRERQKEKHAN